MKPKRSRRAMLGLGWALAISAPLALGKADDVSSPPRAFLDGTGPGWKELVEDDFTDVNCDPDTWTWKDGVIHCTGRPVGVIRTKKPVTNFELVAEWKHLRSGGNSGIFVWAPEKALEGIKPNSLPRGGIEVQILDHGYREQYEKQSGKKATWFTTNGDVFAVGTSKMTPFPPVSPDGSRSFPTKTPEQGGRRVEPLLRPRHQRRGPALGQRRGSLRRQRLRAALGFSLPRVGRLAGRVPASCESANCRDRAGLSSPKPTTMTDPKRPLMSFPSKRTGPSASLGARSFVTAGGSTDLAGRS